MIAQRIDCDAVLINPVYICSYDGKTSEREGNSSIALRLVHSVRGLLFISALTSTLQVPAVVDQV